MQIVLLRVFCEKRIVQKCNFILTKMKIHLQPKKGIVYLLILNVNIYANVTLECSLHANEGHIIVESILIIMKQIWTLMNGYFL